MEVFQAQEEVRLALQRSGSSVLRAWMQELDPEHERYVSGFQFERWFREHKIGKDAHKAFSLLDTDGGGGLTLEELDEQAFVLFSSWRQFCMQNFKGVKHFMETMLDDPEPGDRSKASVTFAQFKAGLKEMGWSSGQEQYLFDAMSYDRQKLVPDDVNWIELELQRAKRKAKARHMHGLRKQEPGLSGKVALEDFKKFLWRRFHGSLIRAWRKALCSQDNMTMHKPQFLKGCADVGWNYEVKNIWNRLDRDGSGSVTLEEFDYDNTELLARFSQFIHSQFANSEQAFEALDVDDKKAIRSDEFIDACHRLGFPRASHILFMGLDKDDTRRISKEDIAFLDRWKPRAFLVASPNPRAVAEVKSKLLARYGTFMRAWRFALDRDSSNRCTWDEFRDGCKLLGFKDDVPGAWRALDVSLLGYITIQDLDPVAAKALLDFKQWATKEFGNVMAFFHACDEDGSNALKFAEFKKCCHYYGFEGALSPVFKALDAGADGSLTLQEIVFLDTWNESNTDSLKDNSPELFKKQLTLPDLSVPEEIPLHLEASLVQSLSSNEWEVGALHPAFRSWANSRRKRPVTKLDGSLPDLALQVNLGSPRVAKRPILLLAPVPIDPDNLKSPMRRRAASERSHGRVGQSLPDSPMRSPVKPSLDSLLNRRSHSPSRSQEQPRGRLLD